MESFLNGYLATILLEENANDDRIKDLLYCFHSNSIQIDPRIENALCLNSLKTRIHEGTFDGDMYILLRKVTPPSAEDTNRELLIDLYTQVFIRDPELTLNDIFGVADALDDAAGDEWKLSLSNRKSQLSQILFQSGNRKSNQALEKLLKTFPKQPVLEQITKCIERKLNDSRSELNSLRTKASQLLKRRSVLNGLSKLLDSLPVHAEEEKEESKCNQDKFMSVEELAQRVVYCGENIQIPKILPVRFQAAAEKARQRIKELHEAKLASEEDDLPLETEHGSLLETEDGVQQTVEEKLEDLQNKSDARFQKLDALSSKVDELTKQLNSINRELSTTPIQQKKQQDSTNSKGSQNRCLDSTGEKLRRLLKQCEQIQQMFEKRHSSTERRGTTTPILVAKKRTAEHNLTNTDRNTKNRRTSILSLHTSNSAPVKQRLQQTVRKEARIVQ